MLTSFAAAQNIRVGVLGLFHPHELRLTPIAGSALVVHVDEQSIILEKSSGEGAATFNIDRNLIVIATKTRTLRAASLLVTSRENGAASFVLTVPDKITRRYYGTLELKPGSGKLTAVVNMDLETAVASVVGAESTPNDPIEALKAQSVATRSYYVAGKRRHHGFDFCDTTHCQLLREPSPPSSQVAQAVSATRGMVLAYQSHPFAAMYTRSCSGHTKTPKDVGMPGDSYPYYSVDCKYCQEHPFRWQRRIAASDAAKLHSSNEASRLNLVRRLGWNTVPGDDFTMQKEGDQMILNGIGMGHSIGLCQAGSKAMAHAGASFREIMAYYYPNSTIVSLASESHASLNVQMEKYLGLLAGSKTNAPANRSSISGREWERACR